MSTIKVGQILLYCHFNKIMKGPGTSFQSPPLNQKHTSISPNVILIALRIQKK